MAMSPSAGRAALALSLALGASLLCAAAARRHPLRLDLTADRRHTLSPVTRAALARLPGEVRVVAWLPLHAPPPYEGLVRALQESLAALQRAAGERLLVQIHDPSDPDLSPAERTEISAAARRAGVPEVDLQAIRGARRVRDRLPFGLVIRRGARQAVMPAPEHAGDIEYGLARSLRALAGSARRPHIAVSTGRGEPAVVGTPLAPMFAPIGALEALQPGHDPLPADLDLLIVLGPSKPFDAAGVTAIEQHLRRGAALLLMVDYARLSAAVPGVLVPGASGLEELLATRGLEVRVDRTVFDPLGGAPMTISRDSGGRAIQAHNPLFPRARAADHPIATGLEGVPVPLAAPLRLGAPPPGARLSAVLLSSPSARLSRAVRSLAAQPTALPDVAGPWILAASFEGPFDLTAPAAEQARVVVVPSATWLLSADPRGLRLLQNAVDWCLHEPELIPLRRPPPPPVTLRSTTARVRRLIEALNLVGPALLAGLLAWGRRRLRRARRAGANT